MSRRQALNKQSDGLELWGGMECTVNRVHNQWFDQAERCGHLTRTGDLALFRELGFRKLRYALPWERAVASGSLEIFSPRLEEMQQLGIQPIAGLVHHGSGPASTSLMDPGFGEKLANYALSVAQRYPWISSYTPVNEPQTTARFSGLYGHWYPHHRSLESYLRILVNELRATVLSMRAIRSVRPDAAFIHTEDGGKIFSTRELTGARDLLEHRRWLGVDLLCGRVDHHHPLFPFLTANGLSTEDILWFADNPCPPTVLGLNYYLTSDRFLDHRTWLYPASFAGGDTGHEPLVDIEALRVRQNGLAGVQTILTEAWLRYGIPVAITEAHLGGSPPDQLIWLSAIWNQALAARRSGVNCVAVTVWALLGSLDWSSLVTRADGIYEPGVFDLSTGTPIPTPLAGLVRQLAQGQTVPTPAPGWWTLPDRLTFDSNVQEAADLETEPALA